MSEENVIVGSPERDIHVQPLVTLEKVQIKNEEDNETEIYKMRSKLYRYVIDKEDGATWKERGVGDVKIMKHITKGTFRLVMRRDKTLKLCANHSIASNMEIKPHASSDKAFVWSTPSDFADGESKAETLCIKFGKPESATEFRKKFEECAESMKNLKVGVSDNLKVGVSDKTEESEKLADDLSNLKVKEERDDNADKINSETKCSTTEKEEETNKDETKESK